MSSTSQSPVRPSIRDILAAESLKAESGNAAMTEKDIADLMASILELPGGVLEVVFQTGEALGNSLGLKSQKKEERLFSYPYIAVVRALVISLGSLKLQVSALFDTPKGCAVEAQLPVDIFSLGGTMLFEVVDEGARVVRIAGSTEVKGQMFDWGKGKRKLHDVYEKIEHYSALLSPSA
ncbi:MAG: hypothetical protein WCH05_03905 [Chlorobiaceae bacterium]